MDWLRVEYPDACNFFIQSPNLGTSESLGTYKRLYGYNFCANGWVSSASVLFSVYTAYTHAGRESRYWLCQTITIWLSAASLKPCIAAKLESTFIYPRKQLSASEHDYRHFFTLLLVTTNISDCNLLRGSWYCTY